MSDEPPREEDEPTGPQPIIGGEEPTGAHRPFSDSDGEPTRLERPIPPYDPDREPPTSFIMSDPTAMGADTEYQPRAMAAPEQAGTEDEPKKKRNIAPFITIALVAILLGLGGGWLLFDDSGSKDEPAPLPPPPTEPPPSIAPIPTTTAVPRTTAPSTTAAPSTTSAPATTSTTARQSTTTTTATRSSSTLNTTTSSTTTTQPR